jgi:hypothetical protein
MSGSGASRYCRMTVRTRLGHSPRSHSVTSRSRYSSRCSTGTVTSIGCGPPPHRAQLGFTRCWAEVNPPQPSHEVPFAPVPHTAHLPTT